MCLIVLYFLHSTSVLSFYIDVVLTLSTMIPVMTKLVLWRLRVFSAAVMRPTLLSLAAPQVAVSTARGATSDDKIVVMTFLGFQWLFTLIQYKCWMNVIHFEQQVTDTDTVFQCKIHQKNVNGKWSVAKNVSCYMSRSFIMIYLSWFMIWLNIFIEGKWPQIGFYTVLIMIHTFTLVVITLVNVRIF